MTQKQIGWIILLAGVGALAYWYWTRSRGMGVPMGPATPGSTASIAGSHSITGSKGSAVIAGRTIDDPVIVGARGEYGEQARCNGTGGRFIKTITPPAFGICVSQAIFDRWVSAGIGGPGVQDAEVRAWMTTQGF